MTVQNPAIFLQGGSHPAEDVRRMLDVLVGGGSVSVEGVLSSSDMAVTESGTPAMSVDIAGGKAWIQGDEATYQGVYFVENRGSATLSISASDPTNDRIDLIVAEVDDSDYSGATDAWALKVVEGTPAGSPVAPSTPDNAIVLAQVLVQAAVSSIVDADITDTRKVADNPGYAMVTFTSSGTFTKADYPWARSAKVTVVAGGGGAGGAPATGASQSSVGGGGGGGGAAVWYGRMSEMSTSETVTVGAGGTGTAGGNGTAGSPSSFGSKAAANGGGAGGFAGPSGSVTASVAGAAGAGSTGDLILDGQGGTPGIVFTPGSLAYGGGGGNSGIGAGGAAARRDDLSILNGGNYGGGGGGAAIDASASAEAGGDGGDGVVIVELFA